MGAAVHESELWRGDQEFDECFEWGVDVLIRGLASYIAGDPARKDNHP